MGAIIVNAGKWRKTVADKGAIREWASGRGNEVDLALS